MSRERAKHTGFRDLGFSGDLGFGGYGAPGRGAKGGWHRQEAWLVHRQVCWHPGMQLREHGTSRPKNTKLASWNMPHTHAQTLLSTVP